MEETVMYILTINLKTGKEYKASVTSTELMGLFERMIEGERGKFESIGNCIINTNEIELLSFVEEEESNWELAYCEQCGILLNDIIKSSINVNCCPNCGQKLDWEAKEKL